MRGSGHGVVASLCRLHCSDGQQDCDRPAALGTFVKTEPQRGSARAGIRSPERDEPGDDPMGLPSEAIIRQVASTCLTPRHFEIYERYCRGENASRSAER